MDIREPAVLEITSGRRTLTLKWDTREEGRQLIAAIARRNEQLDDDGPVLPLGMKDHLPGKLAAVLADVPRCDYMILEDGVYRTCALGEHNSGVPHADAEGKPIPAVRPVTAEDDGAAPLCDSELLQS